MPVKLPRNFWIASGVLFAAATVWINYEVKVNIQSASASGTTAQLGNIDVGQVAPEFSARDLAGRTVNLADYRGQQAVLKEVETPLQKDRLHQGEGIRMARAPGSGCLHRRRIFGPRHPHSSAR